jgi:hypothetical protein
MHPTPVTTSTKRENAQSVPAGKTPTSTPYNLNGKKNKQKKVQMYTDTVSSSVGIKARTSFTKEAIKRRTKSLIPREVMFGKRRLPKSMQIQGERQTEKEGREEAILQ